MLIQLVRANLEVVLIAAMFLQGLVLLGFFIAFLRMRRVTLQFKTLLNGVQQSNLEDIVIKALDIGEKNQHTLGQLEERQTEIRTTLSKCLQNKSVIRFNAFDDLGSELSFAVAFLDANGDGVVISSLYGRDDSRVYAKPVNQGQSKYPLSDEEKRAISETMQRKISK